MKRELTDSEIYLKQKNKLILGNDIKGEWIKYQAGSMDDALKLSCDLQGSNWDFALKDNAIQKVCGSDKTLGHTFYIYYTVNQEGEFKIPRIAIEVLRDSIVSVKGIGINQQVEKEMLRVLDDKLKDFSYDDTLCVWDTRELLEIYNKFKTEFLSAEELRFLYEMEINIRGLYGDAMFETMKNEIKATRRNVVADINKALSIYKKGDIRLFYLRQAFRLELPKCVYGNVNLSGLIDATGVTFPEVILGNLNLWSLRDLYEVELPKYLGGSLDLTSLKFCNGFRFPSMIGGFLSLYSLTVDDLLDATLPVFVGEKILLKDGIFSLNELNSLIAIKREKRELQIRMLELENKMNHLGYKTR